MVLDRPLLKCYDAMQHAPSASIKLASALEFKRVSVQLKFVLDPGGKVKTLFGILSWMIVVPVFAGTSIYVDVVKGSDENGDGGQSAPYRSVGFALETAESGDALLLNPGVYKEAVVIDKDNVSLRAVSEGVVWDGTEEVSLSEGTEGRSFAVLKAAQVQDGNQVQQVFNSAKTLMYWEARWPNVAHEKVWSNNRGRNSGWSRVSPGTGPIDGSSAKVVFKGAAEVSIPDGEELVVVHNAFSQFRTFAKETVFDRVNGGFQLSYELDTDCNSEARSADIAPCSQKNNPKWWNDDYFYLTGHPELIDVQGEWFFDPETKKLQVQSSEDTVHVKVRPFGVVVRGARGVSIEGIHFFATAVKVEDSNRKRSSNITISGNRFSYPSWDRLLRDNLKQQRKFRSNFPATDGLLLDGDLITFSHNLVEKAGTYGVFANGEGNTVHNNLIRDVDWFGNIEHAPIILAHIGADPATAVNGKVTSNTVYNFGNNGIRFFGPSIEVAYNNVFNGGLLSLDTSLIYTARVYLWGARLHHNFVHNGTGIGIRMDGFSVTGLQVDHNVVWNTRRGMKVSGYDNIVLKNTIDVSNPKYSLLVEWGAEQRGLKRRHQQNRKTVIENNLAYRIHYRDRGETRRDRVVFGELYNNGESNNPERRLRSCRFRLKPECRHLVNLWTKAEPLRKEGRPATTLAIRKNVAYREDQNGLSAFVRNPETRNYKPTEKAKGAGAFEAGVRFPLVGAKLPKWGATGTPSPSKSREESALSFEPHLAPWVDRAKADQNEL